MGLSDYKKKRNFKNTTEPRANSSNENLYRFVIQRHDATRLHYDLRLEMEGVLKSWAVPKGPSMNPNDKRLAINTEDHPVKYLDFEGIIPKGNYGAGEMNIWDTGTYKISENSENQDPVNQYKKGNLKLTFFGDKIKGDFALVHTQNGKEKNQWLLIKKKDGFSTDLGYDAEVFSAHKPKGTEKKITVSNFVKPMLATATKNIFNDPKWIYELKWDGYRMMSNIENGNVQLYSRNGISFNSKFEKIERDLEKIPHDIILDGEVVLLDKNGLPQFQKLQNYNAETTGELRYYIFDLLYLNGHSTLQLPLIERKSLLPEILEDLENTYYCDHIEGMGTAFYKKAIDEGMEGVIAKKSDSVYSPGYRSEKWLKIKAVESQEAIICGYTDSESGGSPFGSLILGMHKEGELLYIGNCGSGFSASEKKELLKKLTALETDENPFDESVNLKGRTPNWIKPQFIAEVKFSEWTKGGHLRHPVFKGLKEDKNTAEIKKEKTVTAPVSRNTSSSSILEVDGIQVPISNLEKVYWPESGLRKYDLIDYYLKISEYIMPYLIDRPQNLHRHPNGINAKGFYQKDNEDLPEWVKTTRIYSSSSKKNIRYLLCQNEATLLYMANLGCIEINPWNSKLENLENPTYTVIDLDPSEKNTFEEVISVAQEVKEVLDLAGIKGYCKTSGSSGLHIYIPLNAEYSYEEARNFTKLLCYYVQEKMPKITSLERNLRKRGNKIYLDYLQNRRGQTLAAPYCVRPKEGATVSTPLLWKEVKSGLKITDFNIKTVPERIMELSDIFIPVLGKGINMEVALEKLNNV